MIGDDIQHLAEVIRQELDIQGEFDDFRNTFATMIGLQTRAILQAAALTAATAAVASEVAQGPKRTPGSEDEYTWKLYRANLKMLIESNTEHLNEQPPKPATAAPPAPTSRGH